jgi:hypothetical protein
MTAMPRPWSWNTSKPTKVDYVLVKEYKKEGQANCVAEL